MTPGYQVRRLQAADAPGVTACVRAIYGDSYAIIHPELYNPGKILHLNSGGWLVSVVALDPEGKVVGHYGLERPDHGSLAETGEAMVLPEHRHHGLMEAMRAKVIEAAEQLGLQGIFGQAVTNHPFSQKMYEHFSSAHPCGLLLAQLPQSFHNLPEQLPQRTSSLIYFRYLKSAVRVPVYLPPRHREMIVRIYQRFGLEPELARGTAPAGPERVEVRSLDRLQVGLVRVHEAGTETPDRLRQARRELCEKAGAAAVYLELPLPLPATPALCEAAEADGFFFAGLFPLFAESGDALRLQFLNADLDIARLQIENAFARELVDYIARERDRSPQS
jgi:hypothetical protein